jgi:PAS domain S-box-containing protein
LLAARKILRDNGCAKRERRATHPYAVPEATTTMRSDSVLSAEDLARRLQQQELIAQFGRFALRQDNLQPILDEACRIAAEGMATRFAKVLEWQPVEGDLLVRAGIGWRPGVVGHVRLGADLASPAGYALQTGQPIVCNDLIEEARFRTPGLLAEHGVRCAVNVLIGEGGEAFGVLEVDSTQRGEFGSQDTAFLQALANTLAAAVVKEQKQAALRQSEAFVRSVLEANPDCVKVLDLEGRLLSINTDGLRLLEIDDAGEALGKPWASLWTESQVQEVQRATAEARAGRTARFEAVCPTAKGRPRSWDVVVAPVTDAAGQPIRLVAVSRDVTARVEAAAAQATLLREKDLLMQEIHHRVKNSLQLVQSLLVMQARVAAGPEAAAQMAESAARVRTIAALHDRLYRTNAGLLVEVGPYLEGLATDLQSSVASPGNGREIRVEADAATWGAAEVTTLGLVMTELVINALKYGAGTVHVTFRQQPGEQALLVVEDGGPGLPVDFDPAVARGLGMRLVRGLLGENGCLEVDRGAAHTRFVARFPSGRAETEAS